MRYISQITSKLGVIAFLTIANASSVFAATATVNFTMPSATSVPSLSGFMLVVLSLLLFIVAFKISQQKNKNANTFFTVLIGAGILVSMGSGVKLVSDANAGGPVPTNIPDPTANFGPFTVAGNSSEQFTNSGTNDLNFSITVGDNSTCTYGSASATDPTSTPTTPATGVLTANSSLIVNCTTTVATGGLIF